MIVDTDILVDHLRGVSAARSWLADLAYPRRTIALITHMELLEGCQTRAERNELRRFLGSQFSVTYGLSHAVGETALALMERYRPAVALRMADALIAATCLANKEHLVTGNARHFHRIAGLQVITPAYRAQRGGTR